MIISLITGLEKVHVLLIVRNHYCPVNKDIKVWKG